MNVVGLIFSDDLLFASQITGHAHDRGAKVRIVRDRAQLKQLVEQCRPKCVFLDLQLALRDGPNLIHELCVGADRPLIVGYGSHVDAAALKSAHLAGCDLVLPRSAFSQRLPDEIGRWLEGHPMAIEPS